MARAHPRLLWAALAAMIGILLWLRANSLLDAAVTDLPRLLDGALDVTQGDVASWRVARQSHAKMLAQLFAETPARDAPDRAIGVFGNAAPGASSSSLPADLKARYGQFLEAVAATEGYAGVWVYQHAGRLVASAGRSARQEEPAPDIQSLLHGSDSVAIHTAYMRVRDVAPAVEFVASASAGPDAAERRTTVVLRSRPGDSTFHNLNPTSTLNRSARTSLIALLGDNVVVVATASHSSGAGLRRVLPVAEVPPYVREVLEGRRTHGVGRGLFGDEVAYAAQPTIAPGWALVREIRAEEYRSRFRAPIATEAAIFGLLAALCMIVIANWTRTAAAGRERELARLRTDFVASASHELRTPLAQIGLFSELLRNGSLPSASDKERALNVIAKESQRLATLVDNLLNFAALRRHAEGREPSEVCCDVSEETAQMIEDFAPLAGERRVKIDAQLAPGVRVRMTTESYRQVLINLLDNALKYGPEGQRIGVRLTETSRTATLSVDDEGPGVPRSERENIWQAFYREPHAVASGKQGSGIGLAIVRDVVMQAGGKARVEEAVGGGARFMVEIPRYRPAATDR